MVLYVSFRTTFNQYKGIDLKEKQPYIKNRVSEPAGQNKVGCFKDQLSKLI